MGLLDVYIVEFLCPFPDPLLQGPGLFFFPEAGFFQFPDHGIKHPNQPAHLILAGRFKADGQIPVPDPSCSLDQPIHRDDDLFA